MSVDFSTNVLDPYPHSNGSADPDREYGSRQVKNLSPRKRKKLITSIFEEPERSLRGLKDMQDGF